MANKVKTKSHSGAAKRFKRMATRIKFRRAFRNHILTKKAKKVKRQGRSMGLVAKADEKAIVRMLDGN